MVAGMLSQLEGLYDGYKLKVNSSAPYDVIPP